MNPQDQAVFDPFIPNKPVDKTKREVHLETLLQMALPYLERVELGTQTSPYLRMLLDQIREEVA